MTITQNKVDAVHSTLIIKLNKTDYEEPVKLKIKEQGRKVKLPGYRPGQVPYTHLKQLYGKKALSDYLNSEVARLLNDYIAAHKLPILGQPLPRKNDLIGLEDDGEFSFLFDLGLAPKFSVSVSKADRLTYYNVVVDEETIKERTKNLRLAYGTILHPSHSAQGDILFGSFSELNADRTVKLEGLSKTGSLKLDSISSEVLQRKLIGLTKGDAVTIDFNEAFVEATSLRVASILKVSEKDLASSTLIFSLEVKGISTIKEAELTDDFFKKAYPNELVNTPSELEVHVEQELKDMGQIYAERKLQTSLRELLIERFDAELPTDFLKKLILSNAADRSSHQLDEQVRQLTIEVRWNLICDHTVESRGIQITPDEVLRSAKFKIDRYSRLNGTALQEDQINTYARELLKDRTEVAQLIQELKGEKTLDYYKTEITLVPQQISYKEITAAGGT